MIRPRGPRAQFEKTVRLSRGVADTATALLFESFHCRVRRVFSALRLEGHSPPVSWSMLVYSVAGLRIIGRAIRGSENFLANFSNETFRRKILPKTRMEPLRKYAPGYSHGNLTEPPTGNFCTGTASVSRGMSLFSSDVEYAAPRILSL